MKSYWKYTKHTFLIMMSVAYVTTCLLSCSKNDEDNTSTEICQAILDDDQSVMLSLMEELTLDLIPVSTTTDQLGHEANYNDLINQLNSFSCMEASGVCYGCIQTFPVQSEIRVKVDLDGAQIERVMDIITPEDGPLVYLRMHE